MTMDRVHQQHRFQHQSSQSQQSQAQPSPPLPPHPTQHDAQSNLPLHHQTRVMYRQTHHQNHNNLLLHHEHHVQNNHQSAPPPILHRPIHPPPPPPPIAHNQSHQRFLSSSGVPSESTITNPIVNQVTKTKNLSSDYIIQPSRNSSHQNIHYNNSHHHPYQHQTIHPDLQHHHQHLHQHHLHHNQQQQPQAHDTIDTRHQIPNPTVTDVSNSDNLNSCQDNFTEEVIQAILAAKEALEKPIEDRDERDILLIDNLCSLVHGFDAFPKSVRRALASQAVLIVIDEKGKELIVHNEELDSFCVLIFGECEQLNAAKTVPIRYYTVGDSFGVCEPTNETIRFVGHMITRCENCAFLCVKRDDFCAILTDPANYPSKEIIRHRDRAGNVVCVSQFYIDKKSSSPLWSHHLQSTNPFKIVLPDGHFIIRATESCLLYSLVDGYDKVDQEYIDDFLLLFRVFMTYDLKDKEKNLPPGMIKLCLTLARWLDVPKYGDRVVKILLTWLSSYHHDFELNSDFSYLFFKMLEFRFMNLKMNNQLHLLHATISTKSKIRHVTITRSSREQPLNFSISGGYEKNCGIFITQVYGSICDDCPYNSLMNYLRHPNSITESSKGPAIPPRNRHNLNSFNNQESRISVPLRPGDQILEVNGTNFAAIKLIDAQKKLDISTHLSLTVKYNPSAFHEMKALPEGRRKSSLSSLASVSPYQPTTQSRFTFNPQDPQMHSKLNDLHQPPSPFFSTNTNFGFKSMIKTVPKNDKSRLSSLISSSKQFVKQIRDSTAQSSSNNIETMSKTSDNISDDQSNDADFIKAKSNPDLSNPKLKDKQIESGLSNIIRSNDLNPSALTDSSSTGGNQSLVNVLRVFNAANNDSRYLSIHEETTAREVVMVAVREFNLTVSSGSQPSPNDKTVSSLNWHLYEVSVVPESKTIKQKCLSEQTSHLADRASLCSRFYIKNNSQTMTGPTRLDMGDDSLINEILKEGPSTVTITSLNATLLAVELTLADFDKFKGIEPQQFVYDTFFDCSDRQLNLNNANGNACSSDSTSLKSSSSDGHDADPVHTLNKSRSVPKDWMKEYQDFSDISNKEMFWVVCEILNERNIGRRVKIVKQFVRVADVCSQLRNYNSMFAIISGLGHSCVSRLKRTFEKLKPKYKNQLEKMRNLFNPSKNMSNYRMCLNQTPPPAIPLFPQIKKDLTFTKEGRSIFVRESNDLSDEEESGGPHNHKTIRRKPQGGSLSVRSDTLEQNPLNNCMAPLQARSISHNSFHSKSSNSDSENILVNFSEIRQFTERVRNVVYYTSLPYSNDLLTNTKDIQRNQAQIKKMHEEWQMRKRIRHYISLTLESAIIEKQKVRNGLDQTDSTSSTKQFCTSGPVAGEVGITYDERVLYKRSLDIEPEMNTKPQTMSQSSVPERSPLPLAQLIAPNHLQAPPAVLSMQPPSRANSSPTLSKSSSLSSCSSFNHHLPSIPTARGNLTSSVGKFGTESTESLRKLQALSENVEEWGSYQNNNGGSGIQSKSLARLHVGDQTRSKNLVKSKMFPAKNGR